MAFHFERPQATRIPYDNDRPAKPVNWVNPERRSLQKTFYLVMYYSLPSGDVLDLVQLFSLLHRKSKTAEVGQRGHAEQTLATDSIGKGDHFSGNYAMVFHASGCISVVWVLQLNHNHGLPSNTWLVVQ